MTSVNVHNQNVQKDSVLVSKTIENQPVIENRTNNNGTEGVKPSQNTQNASNEYCFRTEQSCPEEP